jgi:hypothetical protein
MLASDFDTCITLLRNINQEREDLIAQVERLRETARIYERAMWMENYHPYGLDHLEPGDLDDENE